jgi:hypothetical protein
MSIIIRTFVLSVVNTETGSGSMLGFAEGGLHPTLLNNKAPHRLVGSVKLSC